MNRKKGKKPFFILGIAGIIVMMMALAQVFFSIGPGKRYIVAAVSKAVEKNLGCKAEIKSIRPGLLSTTTLRGVSLSFGNGDSLAAGLISFKFKLFPLLRRELKISNLDFRGVYAKVKNDSSKSSFISRMARQQSDSAGTPWKVTLQRMTVRRIDIAYADSNNHFSTGGNLERISLKWLARDSVQVFLNGSDAFLFSPWWDGRIKALSGMAQIGRNGMNLIALSLASADDRLTARGIIPFGGNGIWSIDVKARTSISQCRFIHQMTDIVDKQGTVSIDARAEGSPVKPILSGIISFKKASVSGYFIDTLSATGTYGLDSNLLIGVNGKSPLTGPFTGLARLKLPNLFTNPSVNYYTAEFHAAKAATDSLLKLIHWHPSASLAHSEISISMTDSAGASMPAYIRTELVSRILSDSTAIDTIKISIDKKRADWKAQARLGLNRAVAAGSYTKKIITGSFEADLPDLLPIVGLFSSEKVAGHGSISGTFNGPIDHLSYSVDATASRLSWMGLEGEKIQISLQGQGKEYRILSGQGEFRGPLKGGAGRMGIAGLDGFVHAYIKNIHGNFVNLDLDAHAEIAKPAYQSLRFSHLSASIQKHGDTLEWSSLEAQHNSTMISGSGRARISLPYSFEATGMIGQSGSERGGDYRVHGNIAGDSVDADAEFSQINAALLSRYPNMILKGTAAGDISVYGGISNPDIQANFKVAGFSINRADLGTFSGTAQVSDSLVIAQMKIVSAKQSQLNASAELPVRPSAGWKIDTFANRPASIKITGDSLFAEALLPFIPNCQKLSGNITIQAEARLEQGNWAVNGLADITSVSGMIADSSDTTIFYDLKGQLTLNRTVAAPLVIFFGAADTVWYGSIPLNHLSIAGSFQNDLILLDSAGFKVEEGECRLSGFIPFRPFQKSARGSETRIDFALKNVPARIAGGMLSGIVVQGGSVSGQGSISLDSTRAYLTGELDVRKIVLPLKDITPAVGPFNMHITLTNDSVSVERVKGQWGKGEFNGSGYALLNSQGMESGRFLVDAKNVAFKSGADLAISIRKARTTTIFDALKGYSVTGTIETGKSSYEREIGVGNLVAMLQGSPAGGMADTLPVWQDSIALDLDVTAEPNFGVNLGIARVQCEGETRIKGTLAHPALTGEIRIAGGYVLYLDRKFNVTRGRFRQVDAGHLNPYLDLTAQTELAPSSGPKQATKFSVILSLSGTLENPIMNLRADPPLGKVDIISLLTLGRIRNNDSEILALQGGEGFTGLLAERAQELAGTQITGYASRKIERLLYLDNVSIEGNILNLRNPQTAQPKVSVTKQVIEPLSVTYETVIGHMTEQRIKLSYRILPFLFLDGETDQKGNGGLDLSAKVRF